MHKMFSGLVHPLRSFGKWANSNLIREYDRFDEAKKEEVRRLVLEEEEGIFEAIYKVSRKRH